MGENEIGRLKAPVVTEFLTAAFSIGRDKPRQAMLKARLEVLRRSGFPDTVIADKDLRKGYTSRQVLLLLAAFALIDERRAPSEAAQILFDHENLFIAAMADAFDDDFAIEADGLVVIIRGGHLDALRAGEPAEDDVTTSVTLGTREQAAAFRLSRDPRERQATTIDLAAPLEQGFDWSKKNGTAFAGLDRLFQSAREKAAVTDR